MVNKSKSKLAIVGLLLGSIALGIWGWRVFTGKPRYSLGQLKTAIGENKPNEIEKYLGVEAIATQTIVYSRVGTASYRKQRYFWHFRKFSRSYRNVSPLMTTENGADI